MKHLVTAFYLSLPLVLSGILHMIVVKANLLASLKKPIAEKLFGPNKTWRGIVFVPLATIPCVWISALLDPSMADRSYVLLGDGSTTLLGFALGLAYVLAELPNSYVKRRLGIAAGMLPEGGNKVLFAIVDQADSAVGCAIAYVLLRPVPLPTLVLLVVLGPAIHLLVNVSLFAAGLRKRPI